MDPISVKDDMKYRTSPKAAHYAQAKLARVAQHPGHADTVNEIARKLHQVEGDIRVSSWSRIGDRWTPTSLNNALITLEGVRSQLTQLRTDEVEERNTDAVCVMNWNTCTETACTLYTSGCPHVTGKNYLCSTCGTPYCGEYDYHATCTLCGGHYFIDATLYKFTERGAVIVSHDERGGREAAEREAALYGFGSEPPTPEQAQMVAELED